MELVMLYLIWLVFLLRVRASTLLSQQHLHLTALVSGDDGVARFECWEMAQPFSTYPTVGKAIPGLADVSNISYVVLPPRSEEGLHNPPYPMFFFLLSGLAHVTLPEGDDETWIVEGVNGLMIAADVKGDGHFTEYPSDKPSLALQIPFKEGEVMEHRVVKSDVCNVDVDPQQLAQCQIAFDDKQAVTNEIGMEL